MSRIKQKNNKNTINNNAKTSKRISKLSVKRRLRHRQDMRFQRNEGSIRGIMMKMLRKRRVNIPATEICRRAKISQPTFYLHHENPESVRKQYERELLKEFDLFCIERALNRNDAFELIFAFICKNLEYFRSVHGARDFWMITKMMERVHLKLNDQPKNNNYIIYAAELIGMLYCWADRDDFARDKIDFYIAKMKKIRLIEYGI